MNVSDKSGLKNDIKTVINEIEKAETLVSKAIGDLADVPVEVVTQVVGVSRTTLIVDRRNQWLKDLIEHHGLIFSPQSEYVKRRKKNAPPKKRERFRLWSRDALVIYRAFKSMVKSARLAPSDYDFFAAKWLPLIVETYAQRRNQATTEQQPTPASGCG